MQNTQKYLYPIALVSGLMFAASSVWGQTKPANTNGAQKTDDDEVITLTPFEVSGDSETGYAAATTLAGNRLNTELRDIGNAVSVVTSKFLKDIAATDNSTLLQYTTSSEVGGTWGNFAGQGDGSVLDESGRFSNPNQNTRVRGLTSADNTRELFLSDIPWEGYNVDRVDLQRGANSMLFGQGSPAGIINTGLKPAMFRNANEVSFRVGSYGSTREVLDLNRVLLKNELSLRIIAVDNDQKYKQKPAFEENKRLYAATRWEPKFLKKGDSTTIIKANVEFGKIDSNQPRILPPIDLITPWFKTGTYAGKYVYDTASKTWKPTTTYNNLNRSTYIPSQLQDDNTGLPNHGQMRPSINGGPNAGSPNPAYQPWLGNYGQQFGSPLGFFSGTGAPSYWTEEPRTTRGIGPNGQVDRSLALPFQRPAAVADMASYAKNAGLPFSQYGVYKDVSLTDPSIFDFYNNLIDGDNKHEWQNFRVYSASLQQNFFNNQLGFDLSYNNEFYKNKRIGILSGWKQALFIDVMSVYADGTPTGKNGEPYADGTPNPNVGRPFVTDSGAFSNSSHRSDRETERLTLYAQHDFTHDGNGNWLMKLIGKQTLTGLFDHNTRTTDDRNWQRWTTDEAYKAFLNDPTLPFTANERTPNAFIYLGPSLASKSSAVGANIPRAQTITMSSGTIRVFDDTWNRPTTPGSPGYVDPAAYWHNDYYPVGNTSGDSTQSENPANYVGWKSIPLNIIDAESSDANRDKLTTQAYATKKETSARALIWQGKLWDNFLVPTAGIRKDTVRGWSVKQNSNPSGTVNDGRIDFSKYKLPDEAQDRWEATSKSWGLVAHLTQLFGDRSPIRVSAYYSKSENFQTEANRVDIYGDSIALPEGKTTEKGILLETRDGKYSLKINRYETSSKNASSTALGGAWFIGASQAWAGNWANRFEFNWTGDTNASAVPNPDPTNSQYNYAPAPGETLADAQAREARVIAAWRTWQKSVNPKFYKAWGINLNDPTKSISATAPAGLSITEDSLSKGWEVELNATPVKNLRLSVNAAKTYAQRENIGGAALKDFVTAYEKALKTTAAGDLRIWWGGAGNETTLFQWNNNIGSEYAQRRLQEGTNTPEMRKWRVNAIANYDFDHGPIKGVNVGGGVRWQDKIVIGYRPVMNATGDDVTFDIAHPYYGPAETNFDLWVGYTRKVWKNIEWNIQLNVQNAFKHDDLIPITTQPDGTPASYRIAPAQVWYLTNTFRF